MKLQLILRAIALMIVAEKVIEYMQQDSLTSSLGARGNPNSRLLVCGLAPQDSIKCPKEAFLNEAFVESDAGSSSVHG